MEISRPFSARCHRLSSNAKCHGVQQFTQGLGVLSRKIDKCSLVACSEKIAGVEKLGATFWNSLHSWIYPQSSLPPAVLSVITSIAARGGEAGMVLLKYWHCIGCLWHTHYAQVIYLEFVMAL